MDFIQLFHALVLGVVQGLTEFLPVSSSAHLTVVPWLFGWPQPPVVFDTSLHLGTALALLLFFWNDFWTMLRSVFAPRSFAQPKEAATWRRITLAVFIAMVPAGLIGVIFDKKIEALFSGDALRSTIYIVIAALIVFGVLILWMDKKSAKNTRQITDMTWKDAVFIGVIQIFALIPGVSRSGSTITAGLFRHIDRAEAARFSFLLGTPIIIAAGLYKLKDLAGMTMDVQTIAFFLTGAVTSFVVGYFCIRFFLDYLKKHGLAPFMYYRFVLAVFLLIMTLLR